MKVLICAAALLSVMLTVTACNSGIEEQPSDTRINSPGYSDIETKKTQSETDDQTKKNAGETSKEENTEMKIRLEVGGSSFTAVPEKNEAAEAFAEMIKKEPAVIEMQDYSGFEKVGALGKSLPRNDSQTTTKPGDIVLYQGNQIVIFYGTNSWSYTRLGHIEDLDGWEEALGSGDVSVTFSLE